MSEVGRTKIESVLCDWWEAEMSGNADEMREMLLEMTDEMVDEINELVAEGEPTPSAIYFVLSDNEILNKDDDEKDNFIDFYDEQ